jgi:hypothetical protein
MNRQRSLDAARQAMELAEREYLRKKEELGRLKNLTWWKR